MTPERWRRINELFQGALDREGAERAAFLDASCGSDEALRREVDSLVAAHLEAGAFGEMPESQATLAEDGGGRSLAAGTRLGPYEILDLIAYIAAGGNQQHKLFQGAHEHH